MKKNNSIFILLVGITSESPTHGDRSRRNSGSISVSSLNRGSINRGSVGLLLVILTSSLNILVL